MLVDPEYVSSTVKSKQVVNNEDIVLYNEVKHKHDTNVEFLLADHTELQYSIILDLKKIMKNLGINMYESPSTKGTDSHGYFFTKKTLSSKDLKDLSKEYDIV